MKTNQSIVIVGAGLVGSLLAIILKKRGFNPVVYEKRDDMRARGLGLSPHALAAGRSINLVMTSRGLNALSKVGLEKVAKEMSVNVTGRMMHNLNGQLKFQPYGRNESECNFSISRADLNTFLVKEAEGLGVSFHFSHELVSMELKKENGVTLSFRKISGENVNITCERVFGADGSFSEVRNQINKSLNQDEKIEPLTHDYRELEINPSPDGNYKLEKNALHIWPRGDHMLMALPNLGGSFTVTLFVAKSGSPSTESLSNKESILQFFKEQYPDSVPLIHDLENSFLKAPIGRLGTVWSQNWFINDKVLLIGDAAHGIVPFFGQGMNCGFEDCAILLELMNEHSDWKQIFEKFYDLRKPNTDAIARMTLENFVEMRDKVGESKFLLKKEIEHKMEKEFPLDYRSRYSMVMYSLIPYSLAEKAGKIQDQLLDELMDGISSVESFDLKKAKLEVQKKFAPFLKKNRISLDY